MTAVLWLVAALAVVVTWTRIRVDREGQAFAGWAAMLVASAATIFGAAYPVVVPSTIDRAFDVTVADASVSDYTLTVMTWVAAVGLPVVLAYQAWTYWVFRKRLTAEPVHRDGRCRRVRAGAAGGAGRGARAARRAGPRRAGRARADGRAWCCSPAGLAQAVARVAGLADGSPARPLLLAAAGVGLRAAGRHARRGARRPRRPPRRGRPAPARCSTGSPPPPPPSTAAGGPGPAAVLATTRLHDLGPALATYLPALAQTARRPAGRCCSPSPGPTCSRPAWSR